MKCVVKDSVKIGENLINQKESLQLVAGAWCTDKNRHKVMDPDLALAFAEILQEEVNRRVVAEKMAVKTDSAKDWIDLSEVGSKGGRYKAYEELLYGWDK